MTHPLKSLAVDELVNLAKAGELVKKSAGDAPPRTENIRTFNVFVDDEYFKVGVDEVGGLPIISYVQPAPPQLAEVPVQSAPPEPQPAAVPEPKQDVSAKPKPARPAKSFGAGGNPLTAPMPGMIVKYEKQVGDSVIEGETVVVLEAMKMENALPAPKGGLIKTINFQTGDSVAKGDVLCVIE